MDKWRIEYLGSEKGKSHVERWIDKLTPEQLKSVAKELAMLRMAGAELKLPHSKALGKGLFELRDRKLRYRIYYGFKGHRMIILLAAGDKKSQEKDIKVARKRLSQI